MAQTTSTGQVHEDTDSVQNVQVVKRTIASAAAGTNTDKWATPAGQSAEIQSVRVNNPDAAARNIKVEILDASNVVIGALSMNGVDIVSVPQGGAFAINLPDDFMLPAGYQLQVTWAGMTAAGALDWEIVYQDEQS